MGHTNLRIIYDTVGSKVRYIVHLIPYVCSFWI